MAKVEQSNLKLLLVVGIICFIMVSQATCEAKQQAKESKQRRGITEWRFKRNQADAHANANEGNKFGEYEFYLR